VTQHRASRNAAVAANDAVAANGAATDPCSDPTPGLQERGRRRQRRRRRQQRRNGPRHWTNSSHIPPHLTGDDDYVDDHNLTGDDDDYVDYHDN
jgi:hypothetical protein